MIEDRLLADYKDAMKSGNVIKKNTIQQLRAQILLRRKENPNMSDVESEDVIMKERTKRLEALVQFEKANRKDLIEQTNLEISYINEYLPKPMTEDELVECIKNIMSENNITEMKLMGYAITKCKEAIGNKATSKQISSIVKKILDDFAK